jgi:hypothetical protein
MPLIDVRPLESIAETQQGRFQRVVSEANKKPPRGEA